MNDNPVSKSTPKLSPWFDVIAVFCLAVLPVLVTSFTAVSSSGETTSSLSSLLWRLVVRSLQVSLPILLIMRLREVAWRDYGFQKFRIGKDTLTALGLVFLGYLAYYIIAIALAISGFDFSADANALSGMMEDAQFSVGTVLLVIIASCANGFAEELTLRSYLLTRLRGLTGSPVLAVVVTTILFAAYHSYQGRYGIMAAFATGIVFAIYVVTKKRFWPVAIAHAIMDFLPFMLILNGPVGE